VHETEYFLAGYALLLSIVADPDPANFVIDLQYANKKLFLLLFEGTFTSSFKDKSQKEVAKQ
jgi:hypothetical protein